MQLQESFDAFIKHGRYLRNWSPKTVKTYGQGLNAFQICLGEQRNQALQPAAGLALTPLTKADLDTFVIWMRERGLTPGGCNMYKHHVKGRSPSGVGPQ